MYQQPLVKVLHRFPLAIHHAHGITTYVSRVAAGLQVQQVDTKQNEVFAALKDDMRGMSHTLRRRGVSTTEGWV